MSFFFARRICLFPSVGHATIIVLWYIANMVLAFTNLANSIFPMLSNVGSRAAWLAMVNMVITVGLSIKRTPLATMIGISCRGLNIFHRAAGIATIINITIHALCYAVFYSNSSESGKLTEPKTIAGWVGGLCLLLVAISGILMRKVSYEIFYYLHATFWVIGIFCIGAHQPQFAHRVILLTVIAFFIWLVDRLVRWYRLIRSVRDNVAEVIPRANGDVTVRVARHSRYFRGGQHCNLWIPSIRSAETHPFTVVSTSPFELVISPKDGFTKDLAEFARATPGAVVNAAIEGPYGQVPNLVDYDTITLIAGGSGGSFIFGLAHRIRWGLMWNDRSRSITFTWVIPQRNYLISFGKQLEQMRNDSRFVTKVYVTREKEAPVIEMPTLPAAIQLPPFTAESAKPAKQTFRSARRRLTPLNFFVQKFIASQDVELGLRPATANKETIMNHPITCGRPDVTNIIHSAVGNTAADKRVLVLVCGPDSMMDEARAAVASCASPIGPTVHIHCEKFY
ncbi:hypothetical protein CDD82_817 [Ophiocordyceps australis]|uniref:FAD-binding FR-type domain-containing protein n=1 Tax=Ophiocordyceps australis TaxID=1399860 RepID=A0A2C5ZK44_9HYPO|nr:hypothetical protein CDD82_817 [Ophiocordyceps australis]